METSIWGDASVTYPDWNGTVQLDQRMTAPGLEDLVGLDDAKWMIIGFEISGGERKPGHRLRVYAVDRDLIRTASDVVPQVAAENGGELPVTQFLVHDVDPDEVLAAMTHQLSLHLRVRGARDLPIRIVALGDVPEQEDGEDRD